MAGFWVYDTTGLNTAGNRVNQLREMQPTLNKKKIKRNPLK